MHKPTYLRKVLVLLFFAAGICLFIAYRTGLFGSGYPDRKKQRAVSEQNSQDTQKAQRDPASPFHSEYKDPEENPNLILMSTKSILIHKLIPEKAEYPNDPKRQEKGLLKTDKNIQ